MHVLRPSGALPAASPLRLDGASPLRVLVVDDDPINLRVAQGMLRLLGAETATAGDGPEALARLDAEPFDLVFMDMMLPSASGAEVTAALRARHGAAHVVVGVSALAEAEAACLAAGMDAFYQKPLRIVQVAEALRLCLAPDRSDALRRGPQRPR